MAMLLELLLSNDTRGQAPGESDVKYETHLLKLIHSEFHGTGVKMPVNMNRGRALFSLSELREFMAIICAGDERAMEVSNGCLTAVAALRSSSLNSASASFPFGSIPPCCTMLRALKAVNSPPQGGAGGRKQHKRSGKRWERLTSFRRRTASSITPRPESGRRTRITTGGHARPPRKHGTCC